MSEKKETAKVLAPSRATWEKPSLQRVGHVGEIFQFPGGGKMSTAANDPGDAPRKNKGTE